MTPDGHMNSGPANYQGWTGSKPARRFWRIWKQRACWIRLSRIPLPPAFLPLPYHYFEPYLSKQWFRKMKPLVNRRSRQSKKAGLSSIPSADQVYLTGGEHPGLVHLPPDTGGATASRFITAPNARREQAKKAPLFPARKPSKCPGLRLNRGLPG